MTPAAYKSLRPEIVETLNFFVNTDYRLYGRISERTSECLKANGVNMPDFSEVAKNRISIEIIDDAVFVFGVEMDIKKVYKKYSSLNGATRGYSVNLKTHFFKFELIS